MRIIVSPSGNAPLGRPKRLAAYAWAAHSLEPVPAPPDGPTASQVHSGSEARS